MVGPANITRVILWGEKGVINNIGNIQLGFNYLIDFDHERGGELIFGSDYGIYIAITRQSTSLGREVGYGEMQEALIRKNFAEEKYLNNAVRVLRASYIKDRTIEFENEQDEEIARLIEIDDGI
ncbi:13615_t:CDS:2 [Funneliformis geosporum]|uniref:13615_t:CDS:1 n=1 Tax=Funneliformis geosporum TaxID=1117311 RepID=A0A9W4SL66_9GLOM|nr:13615_t:CDS:2 [Funneliformis geosporum]